MLDGPTEPVRPFRHYKRCPKCGGKDLYESYCNESGYAYGHRQIPYGLAEHMDCGCHGCHYEWFTKVK